MKQPILALCLVTFVLVLLGQHTARAVDPNGMFVQRLLSNVKSQILSLDPDYSPVVINRILKATELVSVYTVDLD